MSAKAKKPASEEPAENKAAASNKGGGDLAGRFGAWWNGKDYVPPAPAEETDAEAAGKPTGKPTGKAVKPEATPAKPLATPAKLEAEAKPAPAPVEPAPAPKPEAAAMPKTLDQALSRPAPMLAAAGQSVRVKALETLWGEGRLAPSSAAIESRLLDAALERADKLDGIGFIGADAALLNAFAGRSDRPALAAEWRTGCLERLKELAPRADIQLCDIDRPRGFGDSSLEAVISCEAFAFADHKNGLVARVHRALTEKGRWVFLDTCRNTAKTPPQAFASAWAEPQLSTSDDIEEMLQLAGFGAVQKLDVTGLVLEAARAGYQQLASMLDQAGKTGLNGREGALFLQELAWEAQSWRARARALEGGALEINLWIADKHAPLALPPEPVSRELLEIAVKPDDAGASEALFDKQTGQAV